MGLILAEVAVATNNAKWKPQFVVDPEFTRKSLKIKDLALFLNYGDRDETEFELFKHRVGGGAKDPEYAFLLMECGYKAR